MAESIMQDRKACYITGAETNLHEHHIFAGKNRNISEKCGFKVWLRADWHTMSDYGVHFNRDLDLMLKRACQAKFEETHTRAEFMTLIGKNYL